MHSAQSLEHRLRTNFTENYKEVLGEIIMENLVKIQL